MNETENKHHRTRNVSLAPEDIRLFSGALAAAYPEARYHMKPTYSRIGDQLRRACFASNRNLVDVKYPSGEIVKSYVDRGAWYWVGHEARRWLPKTITGISRLDR